MRTQRLAQLRGLLAGLLALIVFASSAVAMTVGGSSGAPTGARALSVQSDGAGIAQRHDGDRRPSSSEHPPHDEPFVHFGGHRG